MAASDRPHLESNQMGVADIVFFVLALIAPVGVVVSLTTLSIALGAGAGTPGIYVIAGVALALFAVGYVRMSRRITNAGAFYAYISYGLGRTAGTAAAYVAVLAYNAATIGVLSVLAFFAHLSLGTVLDVHLSWQLWAIIAFAVVAVLSYFEVTVSAKVLGVALLAEVTVLLALDLGVLIDKGFHGFSLDVFSPSVVFSSGFGVSLMLAFGSFVGFEATAIYGEEARDPAHTVPRATYIAIGAIALFYLLTTWAVVTAYGIDAAQAAAAQDPAGFVFAAESHYVGHPATNGIQVLVVTSLFASFLAAHASASRYHFALARAGLLPRALARTHPKHGSPIGGSAAQLALTAIVIIAFALAGQDPYLVTGIGLYGVAVIGIITLQALTSFAVIRYFIREPTGESRLATLVAPLLGGIGLSVGVALMATNYGTLTGSTITWINDLPWLLVLAAVTGALVNVVREPAESTEIDNALEPAGDPA
jgi:amino acid transporter